MILFWDTILLSFCRTCTNWVGVVLQLDGTEEFIDEKYTAAIGTVMIRCNNILYIRGAPEEDEEEEEANGTSMET